VQLVRPRQSRSELPANERLFEEILKQGIPIPRYDALKLGLPAKQALVRLWAARRPDIVHVVTEGPLGWSALAAAAKLKLPVATDFHTNFHSYSEHYGIGWLKKPIAAYLRKFHNKAQRTFVPTRNLQSELALLGLRNLQVVARGVDIKLFNPARRSAALRRQWGVGDDGLVVMCVGRMAPEKNLPVVLQTYQAMASVRPDSRLVLVGDGPERARLQREHPDAVFTGMRTGEDLAAQVRRLVNAGAKYVVVTGTYDLGRTPWAKAIGRESLLSTASSRFNEGLLVDTVDLGANVLYVDLAYYVNLYTSTPGNFGFNNATAAPLTSAD
jgi:glycosyltransferase involved in cell wall biosynthesis